MSTRKQPAEEVTYTYDFTDRLGSTTISGTPNAVSTPRGSGANMTIAAGPTVSGKTVLVRWAGGDDGEDYLTTVTVTASDGEIHELDGTILVRERGFELLPLEDVKAHLRVVADDEDDLIQGYIDAALATIDGKDGWLGRAISVQTIVHRLDRFRNCTGRWPDPILLPYPPIISVTSVEYLDNDGAWQTIDQAEYELDDGYLYPIWGGSWPGTGWRQGAVRITYQAGYIVLPAAIRAALLLMVGDMYAARESFAPGVVSSVPASTTVEALLSPYRVFA